MKPNLYKLTRWSAALLIAGAGIIACTDLDELENRVNDLESRVTALESQLPALNETIVAISGIVKDGAVITNIEYVEETADDKAHYEFTLSGDTETYKLYNGTAGNVPTIGINENGNWTVTIDGTTTELTLGEDGAVASAEAVVPQFAIDENGYWTVCTDEDKGFVQVQDPSGAPVPATGTTGSNIFDKVELDEENGVLKIWMAGELDPIEVRVISADEFSCVINYEGQEVDYDTPIEFQPNETLTFEVTMVGVESTIISKPQGWSAELSGTTLTVKAPATVSSAQTATKISANTEKDITIHAISADGLSVFAKMQVELLPGAKPTIEVAVTGDASSYNSVSFTLSNAENMTSYKYLLYPEGGTVPTELAFSSAASHEATSAPSAPITLDETSDGQKVTYNSSYVLYVMPVNTTAEGYTINGAIVSATASTKTATKYSELYEAGEDIVIAGEIFNMDTYGEAIVIDGSNHTSIDAITTGSTTGTAIYFIDTESTTLSIDDASSTSNGTGILVIIGNDIEKKAEIICNKRLYLHNSSYIGDSYKFVCHNISLRNNTTAYLIGLNNPNSKKTEIIFNDCDLYGNPSYPLCYFSAIMNIDKVAFIGCNFNYTGRTANQVFMNTSTASSIENLIFENNIVYSTDEAGNDFRLLGLNNGTTTNMTITNNTFVNVVNITGSGNPEYFVCGTVTNLTCNRNIVYLDVTNGSATFFYSKTSMAGNCNSNYFYGENGSTLKTYYSKTGLPGTCEDFANIDENPFNNAVGGQFDITNGIFVTSSNYSGYGAQR